MDYDLLAQLEGLGFNLEYAERCIEANKHNHVTTTYYLLLKKHIASGGKSNADFSSSNYDPGAAAKARGQTGRENMNQTMPSTTMKTDPFAHVTPVTRRYIESVTGSVSSKQNIDKRTGSTGGSASREIDVGVMP